MKLVTFGDDPSKIIGLRSEYVNIGLGKKYLDLFSKFDALKEYLETVDPHEIIIFVDGYDVVQRKPLDNFETKFIEFGRDLVFSSEVYCWPNPWIAYQFPLGKGPYRFPNSGTFVGYTWAIKKMLEWDRYRINHDDQGYVHDFYLRAQGLPGQPTVCQDYDQVLFQTGTGIRWSAIDTCQAWFVHFNGKSHFKKDGSSVLPEFIAGFPIGKIEQWHTVP
jgi:hypothetical protein